MNTRLVFRGHPSVRCVILHLEHLHGQAVVEELLDVMKAVVVDIVDVIVKPFFRSLSSRTLLAVVSQCSATMHVHNGPQDVVPQAVVYRTLQIERTWSLEPQNVVNSFYSFQGCHHGAGDTPEKQEPRTSNHG
eukprot:390836-Amphidinium_carterae.1